MTTSPPTAIPSSPSLVRMVSKSLSTVLTASPYLLPLSRSPSATAFTPFPSLMLIPPTQATSLSDPSLAALPPTTLPMLLMAPTPSTHRTSLATLKLLAPSLLILQIQISTTMVLTTILNKAKTVIMTAFLIVSKRPLPPLQPLMVAKPPSPSPSSKIQVRRTVAFKHQPVCFSKA